MRYGYRSVMAILAQAASSMERIVVFMVLSRTLSVFDYGVYQQVLLYYLVALPIFLFGLNSSMMYFLPKANPEQQKTVVYQTFILVGLIDLLLSIFTFIFANEIASAFASPSIAVYIKIFAVYPLLSVPQKILNLMQIMNNEPVRATVTSTLYTVAMILFTCLPSLMKFPLIYTLYSTVIGSGILYTGIFIYILRYYRNQKFELDTKLFKAQIFYALPLGIATIFATLTNQINRLIVSSSFTPEKYAIFANGSFEVPFSAMIMGATMTVLIPEFVKLFKNGQNNDGTLKLWNDATYKTSIFLFPIGAGLFVMAQEFVVILYSEKYLASVPIFRIYILLTFLRITEYSALLQAAGKVGHILAATIVTLVINLLLSLALIQVMDISGPAWANVITTYLWAVIYLVMISKLFKIPYHKVMPWKKLGKILLLSVIAGTILYPFLSINLNVFFKFFIGVIIYAVIYICLLLIFKVVDIDTLGRYLSQIKTNAFNKAK